MTPREPGYLEGVRLFNAGAFWEAHEALESAWLPLPKGDPEKRFYQALILLAAAFLHRERSSADPGRFTAPALRCYRSSMQKLEALPDSFLGLDVRALSDSAAVCFMPLEAGAPAAEWPRPPQLILDHEGPRRTTKS